MSLVKTVASSFAALSLVALSACNGEVLTVPFAVGEFDYVSSTAIAGDLDQMRDFEGVGQAGVNDQDGWFTATAEVPIRQGTAMTILNYFGDTPFTSLPAGTVLHFSANGETALLDAVDPSPGLLVDNADVDVMLCGGNSDLMDDANFEEGFDEEDVDGEYWVDIPADEVVVEIEATDDPNVNEVTLTGATQNFDSGELDIVTTTFDVQL